MYFAIMNETGAMLVKAETFKECQRLADETKVWDFAPGTAAPYCLTTLEPDDCSNCDGSGKISDGYELFPCGHCDGTGYKSHFLN